MPGLFQSGSYCPKLLQPFHQAFQSEPLAHMAYYSCSTTPSDQAWYPAATNHVTSDFSQLNLQASDYTGDDQLRVGDSKPLPICHIGSSVLSSSQSKFLLHRLLHVPHITKNLVSIKQFCDDNNVFFQFHSREFFVKDAASGTTLLRGNTSNGLYVFPPSTPPQAFHTSTTTWHARLGHPAFRVVRHILSQLPSISTRPPAVCPACA